MQHLIKRLLRGSFFLLSFSTVLLFCSASSYAVSTNSSYLSTLQQQAVTLHLEDKAVWHRLLHYKSNFLGGVTSQVDAGNFFLAEEGKKDPKAELLATLSAFFSAEQDQFKRTASCRFIARYRWLKKQLDFDTTQMPQPDCKDYQQLMQLLQPVGITLVFPSSDPRSPNSMFGHTLLRIDRKGQTKQTRMLAYAANFAAQVQANGDLLYAFKGLLGAYPGKFTLSPYYSKLREYGQMERRDLWEYRIRLTPEQLQITLDHLYELLSAYYDYYFFTENCAYHVLSALEPAFPNTKLTEDFPAWATPLDTIRILQRRKLLDEPYFQPSHRRILQAMEQTLSKENQLTARQLAVKPSQLERLLPRYKPIAEQANILDLADEYRRYQHFKKTELDPHKVAASEQTLLVARSKLSISSKSPEVSTPTEPGKGHPASRLSLQWGQIKNHELQGIRWRAVYHDLTDPVRGFSPHTALRFLDIKAQRRQQDWKIQRFELLSILSLSPRSPFFRDKSWQINTGWQRDTIHPDLDYSWFRGGVGQSHFLWGKQQQVWILLNTEWAMASSGISQHSLSPGIELGLHHDSKSQQHASNIRLRAQTPFRRGMKEEEFSLIIDHSQQISSRSSIALSWQREQRFQQWQSSWFIALRWYH